jgi:hypothetical protein
MNQDNKLMWLNSVIFQLGETSLAEKIFRTISPLNIDVLLGDRNSPDLIAIPFFAAVIDRRHVGERWWQEYLEYRVLINDRTPCIVIDNIDQPDDMTVKKVFYSNDTSEISRIIFKEKQRLNRFDFYYTNPYLQRVRVELLNWRTDFW